MENAACTSKKAWKIEHKNKILQKKINLRQTKKEMKDFRAAYQKTNSELKNQIKQIRQEIDKLRKETFVSPQKSRTDKKSSGSIDFELS